MPDPTIKQGHSSVLDQYKHQHGQHHGPGKPHGPGGHHGPAGVSLFDFGNDFLDAVENGHLGKCSVALDIAQEYYQLKSHHPEGDRSEQDLAMGWIIPALEQHPQMWEVFGDALDAVKYMDVGHAAEVLASDPNMLALLNITQHSNPNDPVQKSVVELALGKLLHGSVDFQPLPSQIMALEYLKDHYAEFPTGQSGLVRVRDILNRQPVNSPEEAARLIVERGLFNQIAAHDQYANISAMDLQAVIDSPTGVYDTDVKLAAKWLLKQNPTYANYSLQDLLKKGYNPAMNDQSVAQSLKQIFKIADKYPTDKKITAEELSAAINDPNLKLKSEQRADLMWALSRFSHFANPGHVGTSGQVIEHADLEQIRDPMSTQRALPVFIKAFGMEGSSAVNKTVSKQDVWKAMKAQKSAVNRRALEWVYNNFSAFARASGIEDPNSIDFNDITAMQHSVSGADAAKTVAQLFNLIDKNHGKTISQQELLSYLDKPTLTTTQRISIIHVAANFRSCASKRASKDGKQWVMDRVTLANVYDPLKGGIGQLFTSETKNTVKKFLRDNFDMLEGLSVHGHLDGNLGNNDLQIARFAGKWAELGLSLKEAQYIDWAIDNFGNLEGGLFAKKNGLLRKDELK